MAEITILTQDGKTHTHLLDGARVGLGRSAANQLCFPDDSGLSRNHLFFEHDGDENWTISDPGSKNGTTLNGERLTSPRPLKPGEQNSCRTPDDRLWPSRAAVQRNGRFHRYHERTHDCIPIAG